MSSTSGTKALGWTVAATLVAGATLGGCSDIYYDRRDTIALGADDAVASNRVTHMVDPWPRYSANRNIAFNGERMGCAIERYRHNTVIQPRQVTTSSAASQSAPQSSDAIAPCAAAPSAAAVAPQAASPAAIK
jgi:hypothetical protein